MSVQEFLTTTFVTGSLRLSTAKHAAESYSLGMCEHMQKPTTRSIDRSTQESHFKLFVACWWFSEQGYCRSYICRSRTERNFRNILHAIKPPSTCKLTLDPNPNCFKYLPTIVSLGTQSIPAIGQASFKCILEIHCPLQKRKTAQSAVLKTGIEHIWQKIIKTWLSKVTKKMNCNNGQHCCKMCVPDSTQHDDSKFVSFS